MMSKHSPLVGLAIVLAFAVSTWLCVALTRFTGGFAMLWVSTALLVPLLAPLRSGRRARLLAACGLASITITGTIGMGWAMALPLAIANLGEAALTLWAIDLANRRHRPAMSLPWVSVVYFCGVLAAPALSGLVAASASDALLGSPFLAAWSQWIVAHALGFVTVFPVAMILALGKAQWRPLGTVGGRNLPAMLAPLIMAAVCVPVFRQTTMPLLFVPPMLMIYAMVLADTIVAAIMLAVLMVVGGALTLAGYGPVSLMHGGPTQHLQFFQFYILCVALTGAPIAVMLERRHRLFDKLSISEARYRLLADFSTDIIMISDRNGVLSYVSPSIEQIGRHARGDLVGKVASAWISAEHWPAIVEAHQGVLAQPGSTARVEFLGLISSQQHRWFETHMRAIVRDDGRADGVCSVIRDISQRKKVEAELEAAALTDPLTGLGNRRAFEGILAGAGELDSEGCVAVLDLDWFKAVNDTHGHAVGDEVLRAFARVARGALRESDMLARLGGEEFAIFLPGTSLSQAELVCQRLRRALDAYVTRVGEASIHVTVSIGLANVDQDIDSVIKRADAALYRAKAGGRNRLMLAA